MELLPGYQDPYSGRTLTKGEVGCFLSHYSIWEEVRTLPPRPTPLGKAGYPLPLTAPCQHSCDWWVTEHTHEDPGSSCQLSVGATLTMLSPWYALSAGCVLGWPLLQEHRGEHEERSYALLGQRDQSRAHKWRKNCLPWSGEVPPRGCGQAWPPGLRWGRRGPHCRQAGRGAFSAEEGGAGPDPLARQPRPEAGV